MFLRRSHIAALHDIGMAALSFLVALYLRHGEGFLAAYPFIWEATALFTLIAAVVFFSMKLYSGLWRYASLSDLIQLTKAVTIALLIFTVLLFFVTRLENFPRSAIIINWLVLMALLGGPRFIYRNIKDNMSGIKTTLKRQSGFEAVPVLLVGANPHSEMFIRQMKQEKEAPYNVVGILEDNTKRKGSRVHGVAILGCVSQLEKVLKKLKKSSTVPQRVVVSDAANGVMVRELLELVEAHGLSLAKLPSLAALKDGREEPQVQSIAIEDLLGRAQRVPNIGRRKSFVSGKHVLVTGAGGTIGSELVRQLSQLSPASIALFEMSEYHLYKVSQELAADAGDVPFRSIIGDVRDKAALESAFKQAQPELVFHAAALKHVPIVEENVEEAVLTNVLGTKLVADACAKFNAEKMVMISTDKAVHPSSLMGVTKRVAEFYVQAASANYSSSKTDFATVRFGNVLGSSGSVIPLFQKQLEAGGPITVTHPDMTRYFMTVPEAVELVLQASTVSSAETGEKSSVFVLDMGEPIRIKDLAEQMIRLSGKADIAISYSGVREGEKLYEELFYDFEEKMPTVYDDIQQAVAQGKEYAFIEKKLHNLFQACHARDAEQVVVRLKELVPEYIKPDYQKESA